MEGTLFFSLIGATFVASLLTFFLFWVLFQWKDNLGLADLAWALSIFLSGLAFYCLSACPPSLKLVFTLMILIWSGRLLWHLLRRFQFNLEDPRYTYMRQVWIESKADVSSRALGIYIIQAVLVTFLMLPAYLIGAQSNLQWSSCTFSASILWAISVYGVTVADEQLYRFRSHPENFNKVCNTGLWRYSRHPNYFFEWLVWVSLALFAWPTSWGVLSTLSPLLILLLLTKVTGIPATEAHALQSKGEAYYNYQQKTSAFVPWFPK